MIRKLLVGLGSVALVSFLAACGGPSDDPTSTDSSSMAAPPTSTETSAMSTPSNTTSTDLSHPPSDIETSPAQSPSSTSNNTTNSSSNDMIPESLHGTWALVDDGVETVSAEQCESPMAPPGTVITVDATTIQFFETTAELKSVKQIDTTSLEADFREKVADNVFTRGIRLESQGDGQALVMTDLGEGGIPGPQRHLRCPE